MPKWEDTDPPRILIKQVMNQQAVKFKHTEIRGICPYIINEDQY